MGHLIWAGSSLQNWPAEKYGRKISGPRLDLNSEQNKSFTDTVFKNSVNLSIFFVKMMLFRHNDGQH